MRVKELIEHLQNMPQEAQVLLDMRSNFNAFLPSQDLCGITLNSFSVTLSDYFLEQHHDTVEINGTEFEVTRRLTTCIR